MQSILLSLKLVETFAYNSVYFHKGEDFFSDEVFGLLKMFYMILILLKY